MKRYSLLFLLIFPAFIPDKGRYVTGQKIEEGYHVCVRERCNNVNGDTTCIAFLNFEDGSDAHWPFASYRIDSIQKIALRNYFSEDTVTWKTRIDFYTGTPQVRFVNRNLGFMYGTNGSLMYWPFMYRTEDGGKSWTLLIQRDLGASLVIDPEQFYMFNEKQGIIVWQNGSAVDQAYSITSDGGKTWTRGWVKTGYYNASLTTVAFSKQGEVTMMFQGVYSEEKGAVQQSSVYKSTDFGKSFRELK